MIVSQFNRDYSLYFPSCNTRKHQFFEPLWLLTAVHEAAAATCCFGDCCCAVVLLEAVICDEIGMCVFLIMYVFIGGYVVWGLG